MGRMACFPGGTTLLPMVPGSCWAVELSAVLKSTSPARLGPVWALS